LVLRLEELASVFLMVVWIAAALSTMRLPPTMLCRSSPLGVIVAGSALAAELQGSNQGEEVRNITYPLIASTLLAEEAGRSRRSPDRDYLTVSKTFCCHSSKASDATLSAVEIASVEEKQGRLHIPSEK
jgi:hypothetical protein